MRVKNRVAIVLASCCMLATRATHLSSSLQDTVKALAINESSMSWENGTLAEALLEEEYAAYSVFSPAALFPLSSSLQTSQIQKVVDLAQVTLENRLVQNLSTHGGRSLLEDGAAGDPASLGIAVLLANWTTGNAVVNGVGYGDAALAELNYLLYDVPRTSTGAISHRASQAQLWSDSVYMDQVPPFLAFYGALHENQTLLQEAYNQCKLYRDTLKQSNGLWAHILLGTETHDASNWATGNGWAAAGMLRVHATIERSTFSESMSSQRSDLQSWISEILTAVQSYVSILAHAQTEDFILHNHIDNSSTFEEAAGAALLAATSLRMSTQNLTNDHVDLGVNLLNGASSKVNTSTGYVSPVVNPYDFTKQGTTSPEAQTFVVMAYAAYNQWVSQGKPGNVNGSSDPLGKSSAATPTRGMELRSSGWTASIILISFTTTALLGLWVL